MTQQMVYEWGRQAYAVSPQVVGETVEAIVATHGHCQPSQLVEAARDDASPLHRLFTWDDETAATNWRSHEARRVINSLVITVQTGGQKLQTPAFISVGHRVSTQEEGEGYRPISVVAHDPLFSQEALGEALSRLRAIRARYNAIEALAPVWQAVDEVESA